MSSDLKASAINVSVFYAGPKPSSSGADPFETAIVQIGANAGIEILPALDSFAVVNSDAQTNKKRLVIIYPSLQDAIRLTPLNLSASEKTAADWADMARALLDLFRANRKNIILIEAGGLARGPSAWMTIFRSQIGASDDSLRLARPVTVPSNPLDDLHILHVQQKTPVLKTLMRELEACSLPVLTNARSVEEPDLTNALTYLEEYGGGVDYSALCVLQDHLAVALKDLDAAEDANRAIKREQEELRSALNTESARADDLEREIEAVRASKDENIRARKREGDKLRDALAAESARADRLEQEIKAVRASKSWRITAPIRAAIIALRRITGRKTPGRPQGS